MGNLKKLASQTVIYGASTIIPRFLNWFLTPFYVRVFAPEVFGVVTNLFAWVALFLALLTYGMETSFFRYASDKRYKKYVFGTSLVSLFVTSALFLVLIFIFSNPISHWLEYSEHPEYIRWLAIILALDSFTSIPFAYLRLEGRPIRFLLIKITNVLVNVGFNIFFIAWCPKLTQDPNCISWLQYIYSDQIEVGYVFISNIIASFVTLIMLFPIIFKTHLQIQWKLLKTMLSYGFPILIVSLAGMISQNIDKILLPKIIPDSLNPMAQLGIYGANVKLAVMMTLFVQAFRYAFEPFFFSQKKDGNEKKIYADVMKYFVIFCLTIFLGIMLYIDICKIFIHPDYYSGLKAVPIILMGNLILGIYYSMSLWYKVTDKTKYGGYISIVGAIICLFLNFTLIPFWGYMGSAWAQLICFFTMTIISYMLMKKYYPIKYEVKKLTLYTGSTLVLYFISTLLPSNLEMSTILLKTVLLILFFLEIFFLEIKIIKK